MTANSLDALAAKAKAYPPVSKSTRREAKVAEAVKAVTDLKVNAADVLNHKIVQASFAVTSNRPKDASYGLGVTIPAGAVVTRVWTKVGSAITSTGTNGTATLTLGDGGTAISNAFTCDGSTILPYTLQTTAAATAATAKELTVAVATNQLTGATGKKIDYIVEYIIPA